MKPLQTHIQMLTKVAQALGPELCKTMTFVGGCTTGLLITDDFTKEAVRHTDDVDLIIHVMGYAEYLSVQNQLQKNGFKIMIPTEEDPICAMYLGELRVDFMPDDASILGFSNRWYRSAVESSLQYQLNAELSINIVEPVHFIATKLEAYKGRGNNDLLASRDIEDILNLVEGRTELANEIKSSSEALRHYIVVEFQKLMDRPDFQYAVQSQVYGEQYRINEIYSRLERILQENMG